MRRSPVTFEDLGKVLPPIDELEDLRLGIVSIAVPDPEKKWDDSGSYTTIDKRVVSPDRLDEVLTEVESAIHEFTRSLFASIRPLLIASCEGDHGAVAEHLISLGDQYENAGRRVQALRYFESALQVLEPLPEREGQIVVLRRIARLTRAMGDLDRSQLNYRRSAEIARDVEDLEGEVIARTGYGNILAIRGMWDAAEEVYSTTLRRLDESGPRGEHLQLARGQLYINLGMIASRQERLGDAEEWLQLALELPQVKESPVDLALCYNNLADFLVRQGRHADAHQVFEATRSLPLPPGTRVALAVSYAESLLQQGRLTDAVRWGREAEEQAIRARSPYSLVEMYQTLGNIARERGAEDGFTFYEKALQLAREKGYTLLEGETLVDYARLRNRMGGQEEALSYLQRAIDIFESIGAHPELARARDVLEELTAEPVL